MRPLSELLQLVYDELNHQDNVNGNKTESIYYSGLCECRMVLWGRDMITDYESEFMHRYIYYNQPKNKYCICYFWEPFLLEPRNQWLKEHIKINKEKENGKSKD